MGAVLHRENVDGTLTSPCSDSEQKAIKKSSGEISWLPFTYLRNYYYFIHLIKKKNQFLSRRGAPPQLAHLPQEPSTTAAAWQLPAGEGNCLGWGSGQISVHALCAAWSWLFVWVTMWGGWTPGLRALITIPDLGWDSGLGRDTKSKHAALPWGACLAGSISCEVAILAF